MPVDTGRQPTPLCGREGEGGGIRGRPDEVAAMQAPLTKPNAGAIPDQQLEPILAAIAKGVGTAVAGRTAQRVLDSLREPVDAGAHVDRLDNQPNLTRCRDHGSCPSTSANHGALPVGSSIRQPPGLCRRITPAFADVLATLTGTKVSDELAVANRSLSLRRQR